MCRGRQSLEGLEDIEEGEAAAVPAMLQYIGLGAAGAGAGIAAVVDHLC